MMNIFSVEGNKLLQDESNSTSLTIIIKYFSFSKYIYLLSFSNTEDHFGS